MKETKIIERISDLVEKINYKTAYIEIQTENNKFTLEKEKHNEIGFRRN